MNLLMITVYDCHDNLLSLGINMNEEGASEMLSEYFLNKKVNVLQWNYESEPGTLRFWVDDNDYIPELPELGELVF